MMFLIPLAILIFLILVVVGLYNSLVNLKARVDEAWSGIDVQLKKRADLVPNLVETVKGYVKHEDAVFTKVSEARSSLMSAKTPAAKAEANNELSGALKSLFAVAEAYPELKASENFRDLQGQLQETEDKVAYSRQFYNANVLDYNVKIKVFPNVLLAGVLGFKEAEFFKASEEDRQTVKVSF